MRFGTSATDAEIPLNCEIGGGLLISHPNGIVIHPDAVIGVNSPIFSACYDRVAHRGGGTGHRWPCGYWCWSKNLGKCDWRECSCDEKRSYAGELRSEPSAN